MAEQNDSEASMSSYILPTCNINSSVALKHSKDKARSVWCMPGAHTCLGLIQ